MEKKSNGYRGLLNVAKIITLLLAIPVLNLIVNILGVAYIALFVISIVLLTDLKRMDFVDTSIIKTGLIFAMLSSVLNFASSAMFIVFINYGFEADRLGLIGEGVPFDGSPAAVKLIMSFLLFGLLLFLSWIGTVVSAVLLSKGYNTISDAESVNQYSVNSDM